MKQVEIDFLYLDLSTCTRCLATDDALDEALSALSDVLCLLDYELRVNKLEMTTRALAEEYRFESSPTIRVNGVDICHDVVENECEDCGDLCGETVDCRVFIFEGVHYEKPPAKMIADGILRILFGESEPKVQAYALPKNLADFYKSKAVQNAKKKLHFGLKIKKQGGDR